MKRSLLTLLHLPRTTKRLLVLAVDASFCVLTVWMALCLRYEAWVPLSQGSYPWIVLASIVLALPLFVVFGLYRAIFRYSGWPALMTVTRAVGTYGLLFAAIFTAHGFVGIPRTVGLIQPILLLLSVGASRALAGYWLGGAYQAVLRRNTLPAALVYGAGETGRQLASALAHSSELRVMAFLDDAPALHHQVLNGLTIYPSSDVPELVVTLGIQRVLLAMPSISRKRRQEILDRLMGTHVIVQTLPRVSDLAHGRISIADLREPEIEDLLGRDPVPPVAELLNRHNAGKVVLVTGAGGSIGSELCHQLLEARPGYLLLVEQSEFALYEIHQRLLPLSQQYGIALIPLLGSVTDEARLERILTHWHPHTVYHAAAYKHVPLVEHNVEPGLYNNVWGTWICARVAARAGVKNFVLISTDKAVRPTNVMGASKRLAEMVLQALTPIHPQTCFCMVRFGNVLGSSGSVVPLFRSQIRAGGPVTITHDEVTRYFMTIPEAAQLVIQAGAMAVGGDVFVLDMGEPVRIVDLARRMIELSGLTVRDEKNPEGDIPLEVTGLRPGEKLYEELLIGNNPEPTLHPRIQKAHEHCLPWEELLAGLQRLEAALDTADLAAVRCCLQELVAGYQPGEGLVDWLERGWKERDDVRGRLPKCIIL